jgi:hypothetical protein
MQKFDCCDRPNQTDDVGDKDQIWQKVYVRPASQRILLGNVWHHPGRLESLCDFPFKLESLLGLRDPRDMRVWH